MPDSTVNAGIVELSCLDKPLGPPPPPLVLTENEANNQPNARWEFLGREGWGEWPYGARADLTITRLDGDQIEIWRTDVTGSSQGLTALYRGNVSDKRVSGSVVWRLVHSGTILRATGSQAIGGKPPRIAVIAACQTGSYGGAV